MLKWIQDSYEAEVVCLTVNLGQPGEDYGVIEAKARELGAVECHVVDARERFAAEFLAPAIKANAVYGNGYPLFTALGRPLIAQLAVEYARKTELRHDRPRLHRQGQRPGADRGHGRDPGAGAADDRPGALLADGPRGGDRLRPRARDPGQGRHRGGARTRSTTTSGAAPRRAAGSRTSTHAPEDDVFQLVTRPEEAPDEAETVTVGFEAGLPVSLNGERLGLVDLLERAAEIGCRHGVGIVDHIEDRIVGLKVRDIYEVPAAAIVLTAHEELERLVGTIHQNQFKPALDQKWGYLVYAGLWWEPLRTDLDAYMDAVNAQVTGEIGLRLYKGSVRVVTRSSPNAVYDAELASFDQSGGLFSQAASPGFIELWSLQSRMAHRIRERGEEGGLMYDKVGKAAVRFAFALRCAAATGARSGSASASPRSSSRIGAYLASRNVPEG